MRNFDDCGFMEAYKTYFHFQIETNLNKKRKTGICILCRKPTSKITKHICLQCSEKRIKKRYIENGRKSK